MPYKLNKHFGQRLIEDGIRYYRTDAAYSKLGKLLKADS